MDNLVTHRKGIDVDDFSDLSVAAAGKIDHF
jgi:hypothetical protein